MPDRIITFVTGYEANYLINRLEQEKIAFEDWREKKRIAGEWRSG